MRSASPRKTNEQVRLSPIALFGASAPILILSAAIGLLFAGNVTAMRAVAVLAGPPSSAVLILLIFGLYKAMRTDYEALPGSVRASLTAAH